MSVLRLITWNCRIGAFHSKAERIARLRPDVLAMQEVEPPDGHLGFEGGSQPAKRDRMGDPGYPRASTGMFSYTGTILHAVDRADPMDCFRRYEAYRGDLIFQMIAVWTADTDSRQTAFLQAHQGIRRHRNWIKQRPTVILGNFNANASYSGTHWDELMDLVRPLELVSAYHRHFDEAFGFETRNTYFYRGNRSPGFHIDYCFLPGAWASQIGDVQVGSFEDWQDVSDHVPLIVDIALPVVARDPTG
jgi:endonuclease/exonuclease/phosphatase family metal-dependent hydrolase